MKRAVSLKDLESLGRATFAAEEASKRYWREAHGHTGPTVAANRTPSPKQFQAIGRRVFNESTQRCALYEEMTATSEAARVIRQRLVLSDKASLS